MKSILALAIVLLSNIAISCISNQKIYEEFISTNISLPFSRMEQIGGDSIWNKDSELTHVVSIDSIQCASCLANKIVLWHEFEKEIRQYNRKYNICFILSGDKYPSEKSRLFSVQFAPYSAPSPSDYEHSSLMA